MSVSTPLHQLSAYFEPELLAEIDRLATVRTASAGTVLIEPGLPVRFVPIVLEGSLKIVRPGLDANGGELLLYYLHPSDSCALSFNSLLTGQLSQIRAVVEENTRVLMIPVDVADTWMGRYPRWRAFVFQTYQRRFDNLLDTLDSVAFRQLDERLLTYLVQKSQQTGGRHLYITHEDIARDLNTSREVVSRLLKQLERLGRVDLSRNKISMRAVV